MREGGELLLVMAVMGLAGMAKAEDSARGRDDDQACMERNASLRDELKEAVEANSECGRDTDCQVVSVTACPLGCYVAVTKKNVERIRTLVKEVTSRLDPACQCMYKCSALPKSASCVKGHCSIGGGLAAERQGVMPIYSAMISLRPSITRAISSSEARANFFPIRSTESVRT
jgi:hypothetical protein